MRKYSDRSVRLISVADGRWFEVGWRCLNIKTMDEKKCCLNCVWRNSQPNEMKMIYCKILQTGVYAYSVPCVHYELYDDDEKPF